MTTTLNLIGKQTVGAGGASSVTFSNIPQTFSDLKLVISTRSSRGSGVDYDTIKINGTVYTVAARGLQGNGSSASSFTDTIFYSNTDGSTNTSSTFSSNEFYIPNYTGSQNKSISLDSVTENNGTTAYALMNAGLVTTSSPVTSILIDLTASGAGASFAEYSTFYLYGISNSSTQNTSVPYASGGDVITTDGTYWYHAFKYSGTFTPLKNLSADVLVVAGGGGGGYGYYGGGGGAGGLAYQASRSVLANTSLTCTIGASGAGSTNTSNKGSNGSNTVFDTITAIGGGGGGSRSNVNGVAGGSGGGGAQAGAGSTGGSASQGNSGGATGYGNRGGNVASGGSLVVSTGGGGAGAAGEDKSSLGSSAGNGGNGLNTWSASLAIVGLGVYNSGDSTYYIAGGGAGSTANPPTLAGLGGLGGGGNGVVSGDGGNAVANTGSGGAGGGGISNGGAGGSGLILVRYAV
jgi:hypothetical protein